MDNKMEQNLNYEFQNLQIEETKSGLSLPQGQAQSLLDLQFTVYLQSKSVHTEAITGISVNKEDDQMFLTISEDNTMRVWDLRLSSSVKLIKIQNKNDQVANCLLDSFSAWAACGNQIQMFDIRKPSIILSKVDLISSDFNSEINQITFDKHNQLITCSMDSGDNYIVNKQTLEIVSKLKGQHQNSCFSSDFIYDDQQDQQYCVTSSFDYNIVLWDYVSKELAQPVKKTDLNVLHPRYAAGAISPPVIYSVVSDTNRILVSVETGHIYQFSYSELIRSKNLKKKPILPDFVLDAHMGKVMRSIYCHFDRQKFVSVSNDCTFAIWKNLPLEPQMIRRIQIPDKPNWIETCSNNVILIGDVSNKLSIYQLK